MLCRIGGRLGSIGASQCGANVEIPPCMCWNPNLAPLSGAETASDGEFDWGGRLLNSNGGAQRFPQTGWQSVVECNDTRELDCETDKSSRCESRT